MTILRILCGVVALAFGLAVANLFVSGQAEIASDTPASVAAPVAPSANAPTLSASQAVLDLATAFLGFEPTTMIAAAPARPTILPTPATPARPATPATPVAVPVAEAPQTARAPQTGISLAPLSSADVQLTVTAPTGSASGSVSGSVLQVDAPKP